MAVSSIGTSQAIAQPSAQASTQSSTAATDAEVAKLGLPPTLLAAAASTNTLNAELASSTYGIDPNLVGGVYANVTAGAGIFANTDLLPVLSSLSHSNAGQSLALLGFSVPGATTGTSTSDATATNGTATDGTAASDDSYGTVTADEIIAQDESNGLIDPSLLDPTS